MTLYHLKARFASSAVMECSPATTYLLDSAPETKATVTADEGYYSNMPFL